MQEVSMWTWQQENQWSFKLLLRSFHVKKTKRNQEVLSLPASEGANFSSAPSSAMCSLHFLSFFHLWSSVKWRRRGNKKILPADRTNATTRTHNKDGGKANQPTPLSNTPHQNDPPASRRFSALTWRPLPEEPAAPLM